MRILPYGQRVQAVYIHNRGAPKEQVSAEGIASGGALLGVSYQEVGGERVENGSVPFREFRLHSLP
jgi:hypothetical protein